MFGLIHSDRSDDATGRIVRRRFRGYGQDFGPLIAAGLNLTANTIAAGLQVYQADQAQQRQQQAASACASYGAGYYYNPATGQCMPPPSTSLFSSIDPTTIAIGAGLLGLLFIAGRK